MSSSSLISKAIILNSTDGETFEIEEKAGKLSLVLKPFIKNGCVKPYIPIPNVNGYILSKVITFCHKYIKYMDKEDEETAKSIKELFVNEDEITLLKLVEAARYLDIEGLFNLAGWTLIEKCKEKNAEEKREIINMDAIDDLSPREAAALHTVFPRAFD